MTSWQDRAYAAAQALIVSVGSAYNVATSDIQSAAAKISREYGTTTARQIEQEIRRQIEKKK